MRMDEYLAGEAKRMKDKFHQARKEAVESGMIDPIKQNNGVYTAQMIRALKDMADTGTYPDGTFSDIDCNVWSMFR